MGIVRSSLCFIMINKIADLFPFFQVTSIEAIKDVLESWDNEHTDQLLTKIEAEKERRKEKVSLCTFGRG